jgi:pyruvate dehydrogenase E1 component alpha subunit
MTQCADAPATALPAEEQLSLLETMVRIRAFETKLSKFFTSGKVPGFVHLCVGEEAVAVGACSALRPSDRITSTHRGHGHMIAKGADPKRMMAEIFGRVDGYCKGKGGSMHILAPALGILGANGIVGAGIPLATGAALADSLLGRSNVTICFFGDGAANQGVLLEALNLSSLWKLPVIYLCENNGFTEWMRTESITAGKIADRGAPFGVPSFQVDGNDVLAVRDIVEKAVTRARNGNGPTLVEAQTYRQFGHEEGEEAFTGPYRSTDEVDAWRGRDPIALFKRHLSTAAIADEDLLNKIELAAETLAEEAVAFAEDSPYPEASDALRDVYDEAS